jgi:hypothetical protein
MSPSKKRFPILRQPDDVTCGPTSLHSIYQYWGDDISLEQVIREVPMLESGGTLGVLLGTHALGRGYKVWIYTYNLKVFDPSWFDQSKGGATDGDLLARKLQLQLRYKRQRKLQLASRAYSDFLRKGGQIKMVDLSSALLAEYLLQGIPLLTGLSATYLYKSPREYGIYPIADDLRGVPQGHFVVLTSFDPDVNAVTVADPYHPHDFADGHIYKINMEHLVCSILLGVVTYDGNLVVIVK